MIGDESDALPTPQSIAAFVKQNAPKMKKAGMLMMHHGDPEVVREDDYEGHHVVIKTTYHIEVDGKPLMSPLFVTNEGQVQSHGLPNYTFDSAIQLVRELIDKFPEDFASGSDGNDMPDMGDMPGMKSHAKSQPASKAAKSVTGKKPTAPAKKPAARKSK